MNTINKIYLAVFLSISMLSSCIEKIDLDAGNGESQYVVDASIVYDPLDPNKLIKDTIKISKSIGYLNNGESPKVNDASIVIIDSTGGIFVIDSFKNIGNGNYISETLKPQPLHSYIMLIRFATGDTVISVSRINRPCIIDPEKSLTTLVLNDESEGRSGPGGPLKSGWGYVDMQITDPGGLGDPAFANNPLAYGDSYRLKYYVKRNPVSSNPYFTESGNFTGWKYYSEIKNLITVSESNSGDNSPNADLPGQVNFNFPVARSINVVEEDISIRPAFYPGDSIKVEVFSITRDNLFFYVRVKTEITNGSGGGLSGLFATPVTNVPSNIFPFGKSKIKVLGWFGASHKMTVTTKMTNFDFNIK